MEQTEQARRSEPNQTSLPSLEQEWVQSKLAGFHAKLATTAFFCCTHDKQPPRLHSSENNMDPGPVPLKL